MLLVSRMLLILNWCLLFDLVLILMCLVRWIMNCWCGVGWKLRKLVFLEFFGWWNIMFVVGMVFDICFVGEVVRGMLRSLKCE